MKKLFIAVLCSVIGMSTYAGGLTPKVTLNVTTLELKNTLKEGELKVSTKKQSLKQFGRRQMMFSFVDHCGNTLNVWVSGASNASDYNLWSAAMDYAVNWAC